jgi:hypothetical protein
MASRLVVHLKDVMYFRSHKVLGLIGKQQFYGLETRVLHEYL